MSEAPSRDALPARFGKYTLLRQLATGGMAEIFLAIQRSVAGFEKLLVIKRILPTMTQDRVFVDMLLHEARIAATLSHPNVVQIFDVGFEDGQYFIAMEHVHGEDLRSIVRQMKKSELFDFPLEHALAIAIAVCSGLAYAHDKRNVDGSPLNIVHRDVSPQNIVVTFTGDVKIVDFGIAKSDTSVEHTKSGKLKGKVPYMSPEQARGEALDARSDVFSAGVILFELTTGKRLFKGQSEFETLKLICDREYPLPSEIRGDYPAGLEAIVMRALAKDVAARYQSARELQADLEGFVRDGQVAASSIALRRFMQELFADKLAEQEEALQQGRHLADIIELSRPSLPSIAPPPIESSDRGTSIPSARTVTDLQVKRHDERRRAWILPFLAGVAVAGATLGYASTNRPAESTKPAVRGALVIESEPPGASIWLNGDLRSDVSPATIRDLPIGVPLEVKLTKEGFAQVRSTTTLTAREPTRLHLYLTRGSVVIDVHVTPSVPVTIALDGHPVSGPHLDDVSSELPHELIVSSPGYLDGRLSFRGAPMEHKHLDVTLTRALEALPTSARTKP